MLVIGIDPGAKGAAVAWDSDRRTCDFAPTLDGPAFLYWLQGWYSSGVRRVAIEKPQVTRQFRDAGGRRRETLKTNAAIWNRFGEVHGIARAAGLEITAVEATLWQKTTRGLPGDAKARSKAYATALVGEAALCGKLGGYLDGRADAICIAEWLARELIFGARVEAVNEV